MWTGIEFQMALPSASELLFKISIVLLIGWGTHFCLLKQNPRWRVFLWRSVLCGIILIPFLSVIGPVYPIHVPQMKGWKQVYEIPEQTISINVSSEQSSASTAPTVQTVNPTPPVNEATRPQPSQTENIQHTASYSEYLPQILLLLWAGITLFQIARLVPSLIWLHQTKKYSVPASTSLQSLLNQTAADMDCCKPIDLRISNQLGTPILCGLKTPTIILPESMAESSYRIELAGIFAHELTHLKSKDMWWMTAMQWLQVFAWFHPLVWRITNVHGAACEQVCDATAANYVGNAQNYSQTLARVALNLASINPAPGGLTMVKKPNIKKRLDMLKRQVNAMPIAKRTHLFISLFASLCVVGLAGLEAQSESKDTTAQTQESITEDKPKSPKKPDLSNALAIRKLPQGYTPETEAVKTKDGKYSVETDWETGNLVIREIGTENIRNLTNKGTWDDSNDYAEEALFANDDTNILYTWYNSNSEKYELNSIRFNGTQKKRLLADEQFAYIGYIQKSIDGDELFAQCYTENETKLILQSLKNESFKILKTIPRTPNTWHNQYLSPNAAYFVYHKTDKHDANSLYLYNIPSQKDIPLVNHPSDDQMVGWSPDGEWIFFISNRFGKKSLLGFKLHEKGNQSNPVLIKKDIGEYPSLFRITRDGKFYYRNRVTYQEVYTASLDLNTGKFLEEARAIGSSILTSRKEGGAWSNNGKKLAFNNHWDNGWKSLAIYSLEDEKINSFNIPEELDTFWVKFWSENDRYIIGRCRDKNTNKTEIYKIDVETGVFSKIETQNADIPIHYSADEEKLIYVKRSNAGSDSSIIVRDIISGGERAIYRSKRILNCSKLSPNGEWIVFSVYSNDEKRCILKRISLQSGDVNELLSTEITSSNSELFEWTPDSRYILFLESKRANKTLSLRKIELKNSSVQTLFEMPSSDPTIPPLFFLRVHPDGKMVSFTKNFREYESWVMENFIPKEIAVVE